MSVFINAIYFLTLFFFITPSIGLAGQYQVIRVVEGDTIAIRYNGKYEKVRMLFVNSPESVHPDEKKYPNG
jgi:micrococcal nuclease